jgi:hypothetical protein
MTPLKKILVGTTMLTPNAYVLRDPVTIGTYILTSAGVSAAAAGTVIAFGMTVGALVGHIAISLVTSWAIRALSPKPNMPSAQDAAAMSSSGILANAKEPAAYHQYIYGQVRKGGTITYLEATGSSNKFLHMIIALAGHELAEITSIYINDEIVTLDPSGFVTSSPWNSKIRVKKHLGTVDQTADTDLQIESNQVDAEFQGKGIAYLYVRLEYDQDVFANGIPIFTALVKGKKVYDPRTSLTAYSNNAALCVRDYLLSDYGLNDTYVDDVAFISSANICDENVTLDGGGTEKRYAMNGMFTGGETIGAVLQLMMTSCAGTLFWGQGTWQLKVGYYTPPVKTFTLDDLRGPISLQTRTSIRDNYNAVNGTFNDAGQGYITADFPQVKSATFLAEDNDVLTTLDMPLPFTTSSATAQRIGKMTLFRGREQITFSADFGVSAFNVQVGDIIGLTNSRYGWTAKEFEVVGWRFFASNDAGDLRVNLTLRETSEAAFDWDAEESAILSNNTALPDWRDVGSVGIAIDTELRVVNQAVVGILQVDLTSNNPYANQFEVQYKASSSADWISLGTSSNVRFEALSIQDGYYDVRARAISAIGYKGAWSTTSNWFASIFAEPPQNVTNFTANVVGNTLHMTWEPVPDLDLSHYKIRYSSQTSGASYQNAVDIVEKIARPANSVTVPAQTGTYFIKAIDKLGNPSADSASFVVYTNSANFEALNFIETLTENPTFDGVKTDVALGEDEIGTFIKLNSADFFDDLAGNFDDVAGNFDSGGPNGFEGVGYYEFADYVDLGVKYVSRVQYDMEVDYFDSSDLFDDTEGNFDARAGVFDGDPAQFDTTSTKMQVAFTDDDPAGTPTWSAWQDFIVGDIAGRAVKFRAILKSSDNNTTPLVRALSATVDMPDRIEAQDDINFTGAQSVTFPTAFKVVPAIGVALSLADGDRYVITSKTRSGFTITVYTGASVSTNPVVFDYVAKGYGKELAA